MTELEAWKFRAVNGKLWHEVAALMALTDVGVGPMIGLIHKVMDQLVENSKDSDEMKGRFKEVKAGLDAILMEFSISTPKPAKSADAILDKDGTILS